MKIPEAISRPRAWVEIWDEWWFSPSTGFRLAVCRIVVVGAQLLFFLPPLGLQLRILENNQTGFMHPQWLVSLLSALGPDHLIFAPDTFRILHVVMIVAGIACLLGLLTRTSAFVFALTNWIFVSHLYSYGEEHHPEAIISIFLLLLAISPSGRRLSLDSVLRRARGKADSLSGTVDTAIWPIRLTQLLLAWSYLSNGLAKLAFGGLEWMNGYTIQQYTLGGAVTSDAPVGLWLVQQHEVAVALSIATILIETFFFLAVFVPKTRPFFLLGGAFLHIGISMTMGQVAFMQHIVLYVTFVDFDRWERWFADKFALRMPFAAWAATSL